MTISRGFWKIVSAVLSLVLIAGYIYVYQFEPYSSVVNDALLNLFTILAAAYAAGAAFLVVSLYDKNDMPHHIWMSFALGFGAWALAEVVWAIYNLSVSEVPVPSLSDGIWYLGYISFTFGFIRQYRVAYQTSRRVETSIVLIVWLLVIGLGIAVTMLANDFVFLFSVFVDVSYPFADLAMVVFAIGLVWAFRGGAFTRPWLGMVVFSISDGLYAWLVQTGAYGWSIDNGNFLSLFVDVMYVFAYLMVGLGFLAQYSLLRYGPRISIDRGQFEQI